METRGQAIARHAPVRVLASVLALVALFLAIVWMQGRPAGADPECQVRERPGADRPARCGGDAQASPPDPTRPIDRGVAPAGGGTASSSSSSSSTSSSSSSSTSSSSSSSTSTSTSSSLPPSVIAFTLTPNPAPLGSPITVAGTGCPANAAITLTLNGALQASSTAAATGAFVFTWTPAMDLPAGTFPLVLTCGGLSSTHSYTITESTIGGGGGGAMLPFTGRDVTGSVIGGVSLIVLGSGAVLIARRRRLVES